MNFKNTRILFPYIAIDCKCVNISTVTTRETPLHIRGGAQPGYSQSCTSDGVRCPAPFGCINGKCEYVK
jgi:hypothetical protein